MRNILFVEGPDDKFVIVNLVKRLRPELPAKAETWFGGFNIEGTNDKAALDGFDDSLTTASGNYGLVIDADEDPKKNLMTRWSDIRKLLQKAGVVTPEVPPREGWLGRLDQTPERGGVGPRIGVWLMPNNENNGALEAFLEPFVPPGDGSWAYAGTVIREARSVHAAPFPDKYARKARLHTWLAWRKEPGRPYGRAIECGDLRPHADPVAQRFVAWFSALFEPPRTET